MIFSRAYLVSWIATLSLVQAQSNHDFCHSDSDCEILICSKGGSVVCKAAGIGQSSELCECPFGGSGSLPPGYQPPDAQPPSSTATSTPSPVYIFTRISYTPITSTLVDSTTFCQGLGPGGGDSCMTIFAGCYAISPLYNYVPQTTCMKTVGAQPTQSSIITTVSEASIFTTSSASASEVTPSFVSDTSSISTTLDTSQSPTLSTSEALTTSSVPSQPLTFDSVETISSASSSAQIFTYETPATSTSDASQSLSLVSSTASESSSATTTSESFVASTSDFTQPLTTETPVTSSSDFTQFLTTETSAASTSDSIQFFTTETPALSTSSFASAATEQFISLAFDPTQPLTFSSFVTSVPDSSQSSSSVSPTSTSSLVVVIISASLFSPLASATSQISAATSATSDLSNNPTDPQMLKTVESTIDSALEAAQTAKDLTQDADISGLLTDLIDQLITAQGVAAAAVVAPSTKAAAAVVAAMAAAEVAFDTLADVIEPSCTLRKRLIDHARRRLHSRATCNTMAEGPLPLLSNQARIPESVKCVDKNNVEVIFNRADIISALDAAQKHIMTPKGDLPFGPNTKHVTSGSGRYPHAYEMKNSPLDEVTLDPACTGKTLQEFPILNTKLPFYGGTGPTTDPGTSRVVFSFTAAGERLYCGVMTHHKAAEGGVSPFKSCV